MYIPRLSDELLKDCLDTFGAVLIEGPKWCGKTTSASLQAASELRIADPANNYQNKRLAQTDTATALKGERPRLIDEWQEVPATWDAVRYECDQAQGRPGQFILTGSATISDMSRPIHSGAGRIGHLRMDTLTLQELGLSSGESSLGALFTGEAPAGKSQMSLGDLATAICHGGWPAAAQFSVEQSMAIANSYLDAIAGEDLERVDGVARNPAKVRRLITSLARNESTLASNRTIAKDSAGAEELSSSLSAATITNYLSALEKIFFVCDIPAWSPALRSPVRIRSSKKRHLADPSLAAVALGASPDSLLDDQKTLGFLFESLVAHDLIVYSRTVGAKVMHYHDDSNLEVDFIVQKEDGSWAAFEVKLSSVQENEGARNVLSLDRKMIERGEKPATLKAVIVGVGGVAHIRDDGVAVIPFDTLGA